MSQSVRTSGVRFDPTKMVARPQARSAIRYRETAEASAADPLAPFDPEAWCALIEDQRARIARAAGVDPSKVKIYLGH